MTMPSLAIAAEIIATCSGVTRTSYWPIADWASCGWLSSAGTELGVTAHRDRQPVADAELRGLVAQRVGAELHARASRRRCCTRSRSACGRA